MNPTRTIAVEFQRSPDFIVALASSVVKHRDREKRDQYLPPLLRRDEHGKRKNGFFRILGWFDKGEAVIVIIEPVGVDKTFWSEFDVTFASFEILDDEISALALINLKD